MKIRSEQIEVFEQAAVRNFEDEMVAHLAEFSPELFKVIKEEQMREATRGGISAAAKYGLTFRGPVRTYLELMLLFGSQFDTDPQYPWAAEILTDQDSAPQMARAERLFEITLDYQEKVSGPDAANTRKALKELSLLAQEPLTAKTDDVVPTMRQEIIRIFPQKVVYIGESALMALIYEGIIEARRYGFSMARGQALVVALMFAFGHGCTDDRLYPWISRTLKDERIVEPAARAERLEKKAVTWLEHVLASLDEGARS
jgi:DNA-directed RNA polymerase subunit F